MALEEAKQEPRIASLIQTVEKMGHKLTYQSSDSWTSRFEQSKQWTCIFYRKPVNLDAFGHELLHAWLNVNW